MKYRSMIQPNWYIHLTVNGGLRPPSPSGDVWRWASPLGQLPWRQIYDEGKRTIETLALRGHRRLRWRANAMKIDGGCHCGYITYEATIDSEHIGICHCTDCQTFSGSAFRTGVLASKDDFRLLTGKPKIYVKTAQSGAKRAQAFCPECGTHVYSSAPDDPQVFSIRTGTARQRDQLIPSAQIWCRSAQAWAMNLGQMKQFPEQPPMRP